MSARIVKLIQGSPEWHAHRSHHRNASETPAVLGFSPWMTAYQFWQLKTGRVSAQAPTAAMAHGTAMEPLARLAYEELTGDIMEPLVMVDGQYSASLDGITLGGKLMLEIKCPKSKESKMLLEAKAGRIQESVFWQIQTQLMVSGAEQAHLYVYDGTDGILLEQRRDVAAWETLRAGWDAFAACIKEDQPPALTDRDTLIRTDAKWQAAAIEYARLKAEADTVDEKLDAAKARLTALAVHNSESGAGVTVTRYWKNGSVDYKKVPQLAGVDLDLYRGQGREEVRVTTVR